MITPEGLDRKFYEICALSELKNACAPATSGSRARGSSATSTTTAAGREVRRTQARAGLPWRSTRTATSTWKSVCSCWTSSWPPSPAGQGQRAARCHPHRVRAENHPAGCGGAGSGAGADRPNQPVTAAHQDHELLMDVDDWTGFSRHFTHLKDGAEAKDRTLLLSAILVMRSTSG